MRREMQASFRDVNWRSSEAGSSPKSKQVCEENLNYALSTEVAVPIASSPACSSALESAWIQRLMPRTLKVETREVEHKEFSKEIIRKGKFQIYPQPDVDDVDEIKSPKPQESSFLFGAQVVIPTVIKSESQNTSLAIKPQVVNSDSPQVHRDSKNMASSAWLSRITGYGKYSATACEYTQATEEAGQNADNLNEKTAGTSCLMLTPPKRLPRLRIPSKSEESRGKIPLLSPIIPHSKRQMDTECSHSSTCSLPSNYLQDNQASTSSDSKSLFDDAVDSVRGRRGDSEVSNGGSMEEHMSRSSFQFPYIENERQEEQEKQEEQVKVNAQANRYNTTYGEITNSPVSLAQGQWLQRWTHQSCQSSDLKLKATGVDDPKGKGKVSSLSTSTGKNVENSSAFEDAKSRFQSMTEFYSVPSSIHNHEHHLQQAMLPSVMVGRSTKLSKLSKQ